MQGQTKSNKGFKAEIISNLSPDSIQKAFVALEAIQSLSIDSAVIKGKEGEAAQVWFGARLCDVWKKILGFSSENVIKLSVSSADGYMSVLSGKLLTAINSAICAYQIKREENFPLKYGYMRLIFPELRKMYWVNEPEKMIIELGKNKDTLNKYQFYFLENKKMQTLIQKDLKSNPYLVMDDIMSELNMMRSNFYILTTDSLFREYIASKAIQNMVLQRDKKDTWKITGINVPVGLKTRHIFFLLTDNKGLFLKSLSDDEQILWENLFLKPIIKKLPPQPDWKIKFVLNDGRHIISDLTDSFKSGKTSLYKLFKKELGAHSEIDHIVLKW